MVDGETGPGPAALHEFCLLKSLLKSLSRMESVVLEEGEERQWTIQVCICGGTSPICGGGGESDQLELEWIAGVKGDDDRPVTLSFKAKVQTVQIQFISRVEGFRFVVCDLSETLTGRSKVNG